MLLRCKHTYGGHTGPVYAIAVKDENSFFSAGSDGIVALWNIDDNANAQAIAILSKPVFSLFYSDVNQILYVGTADGFLYTIDVIQKKELSVTHVDSKGVFKISYALEHFWLLGGSGKLVVFNKDFKRVLERDLSESKLRSFCVFNANVYIGDSLGQVFEIEANTFEVTRTFIAHNPSVYDMLVVDGFMYTCGRDGHIRKWNSKFELVWEIAAHNYAIYSLNVFNGNLISSSRDKKIKMWNMDGEFLAKTYPEFVNKASVNVSLVCSRGILAGLDDKNIKLFVLTD